MEPFGMPHQNACSIACIAENFDSGTETSGMLNETIILHSHSFQKDRPEHTE